MTAEDSAPESIQQACAVPFRRRGESLEFCLINSLNKGRWIFPKGIIDPGETLEEAALKESLEEAGLHGRVLGEPLGAYEDTKWNTTLRVTGVLMEVTRSDDDWPEADVRQRRWAGAAETLELLSKESLRRFAQEAVRRIGAS